MAGEVAALAVLDVIANGAVHSGEVLAERFGISRAALAKRVDRLRDWGLDVPAQAGAGYRLAQPLERLDAARIAAALPAAAQVQVLTCTDSTNTRLLEVNAGSDAASVPPRLLFAELQTAGRGRRGRQWLGGFGSGITFSLAWSFPIWPARLTTLPLAVAVAVARALDAFGLPDVRIKWPNDLQHEGAKLAGILIEPRGETGGPCRVVIGVGLNWRLGAAQREALGQPATDLLGALATRGGGEPALSRNRAAAQLAGELLLALASYERNGFAPFRAEWLRRDALSGQTVLVEPGGGVPVFEGFAEGIDDDGALRVRRDDGSVVAVHAGEVSVRRVGPP